MLRHRDILRSAMQCAGETPMEPGVNLADPGPGRVQASGNRECQGALAIIQQLLKRSDSIQRSAESLVALNGR
jgi:hypothetical protein